MITLTTNTESAREPRADKVAVVNEVQEKLAASSAVLLTEYRGIDVAQISVLRRALREAGGEYKVYKNTLVRRALEQSDLDVDGLADLLVGPTAMAFVSDDAAAVAKALREFGKTNEHLVIKGGVLGDSLLDEAGVMALADLPSRDELLARLAGGFNAPAQKFASLLNATLSKFAYAVNALIEAGGAGDAAPAAEAPADEAPADEAPAEEAPADEAEAADETPAAEDGDD